MERVKVEYDELINYALPTASIHTNSKEDKRQIFLDNLHQLKAEGQLCTPDINDEEIKAAICNNIYYYFYNEIIESGNDHIITVYKNNGEKVNFSLLEALSLKKYLSRDGRYK